MNYIKQNAVNMGLYTVSLIKVCSVQEVKWRHE